jgi:predicted nucleic acid-binding protein
VKSYVLDASVAAKWVLPEAGEPLVKESLVIYEQFKTGRVGLVVPDLFWPEMGNILWKAARTGRITPGSVVTAMEKLNDLGVRTFPTKPLLVPAIAIALRFERTVYDAVYVALAKAHDLLLITADERLANSVAAYYPVRWLGAI